VRHGSYQRASLALSLFFVDYPFILLVLNLAVFQVVPFWRTAFPEITLLKWNYPHEHRSRDKVESNSRFFFFLCSFIILKGELNVRYKVTDGSIQPNYMVEKELNY
jgi:hypothetical protein